MEKLLKNRFYQSYVTTHTASRKGELTQKELRIRSKMYDTHFGRLIPREKKSVIADVGCGNGTIVWWLHQKGYLMASGADVSLEQIGQGKRNGIENLICEDLGEFLRGRTGKFDALILRNVLEHFEKAEALDMLSLCFDALKKGGRLILQTPNAESPFFGHTRYGDFTHETAYTPSSIQQLLQVAGFGKIEVYPCKPVVSSVNTALRRILWTVFEFQLKAMLFAQLGKSQTVVTLDLIAMGCKELAGQ